jgi:uncharacterized membrane protein
MSNMHNVIVVAFEESSKAYQALSVLKQAGIEDRVTVRSAALVERQADGTLHVPEGSDNMIGIGLAGGSLIGMLVGVLGGPVGVLLGLGAGALMGGVIDVYGVERSDDALTQMGSEVPVGQTALIAEVDEYAVQVVDDEMQKLGGTVNRRSAEEVLAALEASDEAARAAEKEARRIMRERRKAELDTKRETLKEEWDARLEGLKQKLSRD